MQRTTGIKSDVGGRARTLFWEANEITMAARVLGVGGNALSAPFYVEGFRHFHVYVNRSDGALTLTIAAVPFRPFLQVGAPVVAGNNNFATWGAGATSGVFYFGEQRLLTDAQGRSFLFSPIMAIQVVNTSAAPVTIDAWVHAQD